MKKTIAKIMLVVMVLTLVFSVGLVSALAATVTSWSSLFYTEIRTLGYDEYGNPNIQEENINQSVHNPRTSLEHYKDEVKIYVTTGSNTGFTVSIDGVTLTGSNMTRTYNTYYESTYRLYYYESTITITGIADLINPDATYSTLKITTRKPSSTLTSSNNLIIDWADFRPAAPTTPTFIYNDVNHPGQAVLTGVDSTMEYRLQSDYDGWASITGESVVFDPPSEDTGYYVRYASPESKAIALTLKTTPAAPAVSLDTTTELFNGLDTSMEMKINGGDYFNVTDAIIAAGATSYIDAISAGDTATVDIRVRTSEVSPQGPATTIALYPRTASPTGLNYDHVSTTVSGVTANMQYRAQGGTWATVTTTSLNVENLLSSSADVTLEIRNKAVSGAYSASLSVSIMLNQLPAAPSTLSIDLTREVVTGFSADKSYQYNTTGSATIWTDITMSNNEFDVSRIITMQNAITIYIREAKTDTTPASAAAIFVVPKRPSAPTTAALVYNNANHPGQVVVTGMTTSMEFMVAGDSAWTQYTGENIAVDIPDRDRFCYVRYAAHGSVPNSAVQNLTLLARGDAPSLAYNTANETVGTLNSSMEVGTDGVNYTAITSTISSYSISDIINATTSGTSTFYIRKKATATAPASKDKTFTLYPRASAPTGLAYDEVNKTITGVDNTMQYLAVGASSWYSISSSTIPVSSLLSSGYTQVMVRYKAVTGTSSASFVVTIDIY